MLKPQMLEAIFVAGSVLAGMTGHIWSQARAYQSAKTIRFELVRSTEPKHSIAERKRSIIEPWLRN